MKNIIEVKNFSKKYGKYLAVDNIDFSVEEGSIFAFLGPNGAGKSTTINTLCTIFSPTSGSITIAGKDLVKEKDEVRKAIGVVFQESTLDAKMTVEENLKLHATFYKIPKKEVAERIDFVLNLVDLKERKKSMVGSLSGGMKRRIEIARGLMHYPKVLFLDEPTTGLDPQTRANIWDYIYKLQKEKNITIFLTTHYMDEAEICQKVAIIDYGKIVALDTPFHLKQQYTKDKAYISAHDKDLLIKDLTDSSFAFKDKGSFLSIIIHDLPKLLEIVNNHKENIKEIEIKKGTLNDVFLTITGKEIRG